MSKVYGQTIVVHQASVLPLILRYDVICAVVEDLLTVNWFSVSEVPFTLRLKYVLGYVHADFSVDRSSSVTVKFRLACHGPDFVAEKSCSACTGMRYQRLFC